MKISIISIGNELLNGKTINSNASFIGKELSKIGLSVERVFTIADSVGSLTSAFDYCKNNSDIVICSGGLGPTNDDMTRKIVADYFDDELICFNAEIEKIKAIFTKFGRDTSAINEMQAYYPSEATLFENLYGTASAFLMNSENTKFLFLIKFVFNCICWV